MTMNYWSALVGAGILAAAAGCGPFPATRSTPAAPAAVSNPGGLAAEGRLEPIRFARLAPNADGLVSEVLAMEGDEVEAGQVIVSVDNNRAQNLEAAQATVARDLTAAYQSVRDAQKKLDDYPIPRIFVGKTPQQAAESWLDELDAARVAFRPYEDTSRKTLKPNHVFPNLPRRVWFDTGEFDDMAMVYKKRLDIAWVNYRKAVAWLGFYSDLQSATAAAARIQERYDSLQDTSFSDATAGPRAALANAEVRAPFSGTITNLDAKLGERVSVGKPIVTIGDFSGWVVKTTNLTEIDVTKISEGQDVAVTFDSMPEVTFKGSVESIAQNFSERQGDIVYTATVRLTDEAPGMRWGMTAHVDFGH
jgi:multidrug resistance efflux pump